MIQWEVLLNGPVGIHFAPPQSQVANIAEWDTREWEQATKEPKEAATAKAGRAKVLAVT